MERSAPADEKALISGIGMPMAIKRSQSSSTRQLRRQIHETEKGGGSSVWTLRARLILCTESDRNLLARVGRRIRLYLRRRKGKCLCCDRRTAGLGSRVRTQLRGGRSICKAWKCCLPGACWVQVAYERLVRLLFSGEEHLWG